MEILINPEPNPLKVWILKLIFHANVKNSRSIPLQVSQLLPNLLKMLSAIFVLLFH